MNTASSVSPPGRDRPFSRLPQRIRDAVYASPRGCYQEGLLDGYETWSGSSLRGKAAHWGGKYAASREALLWRINQGLEKRWVASTAIVDRRRLLVIVSPRGQRYVDH